MFSEKLVGDNMGSLAGSIARGSFIVGLSSTINKVLALVFVLLILWFLPAQEVGVYFIATALMGLITLIPSMGIPTSLTRFTAYYIGQKKDSMVWPMFKNLALLMFALSIITALVFYIGSEKISSFYNSQKLQNVISLIIIVSPFLLLHPANMGYIQGLRRFGLVALFSFLFMFAQIIALLYFIFIANEPTAYNAVFSKLISYVFLIALEFGTIGIISIDYIKEAGKTLVWRDYKEIFSYGIPLYLSSYGSYLSNWTDTLVLGHYVESVLVAGYSAMAMIARNVGYFISMILSTVLNPTLSYLLGRGDIKKAVAVATHATKWYIALGTPLLLAVTIFPKQIINIILPSSGYSEFYYLLYILAPTFYTILLSAAYKNILWAKGRTDVFLKVSGIILIPNILLNFILIPLFGLIGAAIATAASFISAEFLYIHEGRKYGVRFHKDTARIILINFALGLSLYIANVCFDLSFSGMLMLAVVFMFVYAGLLYALRIVSYKDVNLIIRGR